jgi:SAM-dependent methyltransferase
MTAMSESRLSGAVRALRSEVFSGDWPLDKGISETAALVASHGFLANPSGQYPYVYLTRFVKLLSEKHFCRPFRDLRVLDWGCGKGHVSKLLLDLGAKRLDSCDVYSGGADSAFGQEVPIIKRFNIHVEPLQHVYFLPYESATFDVLLSVGVLEHVPNERASLAEISRVLKPGGLFFCFFLPTRFSWTQRVSRWCGENYHDRLYTETHIREMLSAAGHEPLDLWYRQLLPKNSFHYPAFRFFEKIDLFMTENTPLRYLATNIEFVSFKPAADVACDQLVREGAPAPSRGIGTDSTSIAREPSALRAAHARLGLKQKPRSMASLTAARSPPDKGWECGSHDKRSLP